MNDNIVSITSIWTMQYIFSMYIFLIVVTLKTLKKQNEKNTNTKKKRMFWNLQFNDWSLVQVTFIFIYYYIWYIFICLCQIFCLAVFYLKVETLCCQSKYFHCLNFAVTIIAIIKLVWTTLMISLLWFSYWLTVNVLLTLFQSKFSK